MKKQITNFSLLLKTLAVLVVIIQLSSCAMILVPKKQKISFKTNNDSTSIYVNNEEQGVGSATTKIVKNGSKAVVLKTEGYPTQYEMIIANKYQWWALPFCIIDFPLYGIGFVEMVMPKMYGYPKVNYFKVLPKLATRTADEKYIQLDGIKLDIKNKNKDLVDYYINHSANIESAMDKAEKEKKLNIQKQADEAQNKKSKNKEKKQLNEQDLSIKEDTKFSYAVYKILTQTGYIDTINKVFLDNNNNIELEGLITGGSAFNVEGKYIKARLNITWYIKNNYGEKIDSVVNNVSSGNLATNQEDLMFEDAVDRSLQAFLNNPKTKKYLKIDSNYSISDAPLAINKPKNIVTDADGATSASVIIKRKDKGHGSGFAISNDGYILTNYHVIAGEYENKPTEFTVILSNGEEVKAQVVRHNKMRDVALLKVEAVFEKAFNLSSEKTFKRLMEVYAVGTPKSIELGQSVSLGILSNERKANNNNLLQLNMSVNSGNSGGPLFDKQGNLHGIVTSKLVGFSTEGVSFAIPSYVVANYLNIKL